MAGRQIGHRKSCLVLCACFPVVNWRSRPVAKSILNQPIIRPSLAMREPSPSERVENHGKLIDVHENSGLNRQKKKTFKGAC